MGAAIASAWIVTFAPGCVDPTVGAVAAWVEGVGDGPIHKLQVYDQGRRFALDLAPDVEGSSLESVGLEIDSRGRGVAISGERSTHYIGLEDSLHPRLTGADLDSSELAQNFAFTRNGDALMRWSKAGSGQAAFLPTTTAAAAEGFVLESPISDERFVGALNSAADAPVLLWNIQALDPNSMAAPNVIVAYPSDVDPTAIQVDELTELGRANLRVDVSRIGLNEERIGSAWCSGFVCLSPQGRSAVTYGSGRCTLRWWRWLDDVVEDVELDGCPDGPSLAPDPDLIAQIGYDLVVLDDEDRVYLADLSARTMKAAPKLWGEEGRVFVVDRGRVVVLVTSDARVTRIDADGPRVISARAVACPDTEGTVVVSPNGYWVVRTCLGDLVNSVGGASLVARVSPLGTEVIPTVPMTALAVDNEGNTLLYSHSVQGVPRGLFVLSSDGTLSRIDALEPQPAALRSGAGSSIFLSARAIAP